MVVLCDKEQAVERPLEVCSQYIAEVNDVAGQHNYLAATVLDVAEFSHQLLHLKAHENNPKNIF